jgi:hypothetical protein
MQAAGLKTIVDKDINPQLPLHPLKIFLADPLKYRYQPVQSDRWLSDDSTTQVERNSYPTLEEQIPFLTST